MRLIRARAVLLFVLGAVCLPVQAGYDAKYKAYRGDLNNDVYTDLYLSRPADLVMIPLDDVFVPIVTRRADHLVLTRNANGTFTVDTTLSAAELNTLRTWSASSVQLTVRDVNVDGQKDLFIGNFSGDPNFGSGIVEQLLFAANGSSPVHLRAVDTAFRQFITQVHGWAANPDYFEDTAIANDWYHYTGQQQTGWWYIEYIDFYYNYDGNDYLDDNDDPTNSANPPAFCGDYPGLCWFNPTVGHWWVWGTYLANIQVIIEYQHFNPDALSFRQAVGTAFDNPNVQTSPAQAESILESYLQVQLGNTAAELIVGVLHSPVPWPDLPDFPPETPPEPAPRPIPKDLPDDPANDPDFFPERWRWRILARPFILICGLLLCSADGESDEWIKWREIGWEWALEDLAKRPDQSPQPKIVVGETEGRQPNGVCINARIPAAAQTYGALWFNPGVFSCEQWTHRTDVALWFFNYGWLISMMAKQAVVYDIGLYGPRSDRGKFYPCERHTLEGYPLREERSFQGTGGWSYGPCTLDDPQALP